MNGLTLATEDALSEAVGLRLMRCHKLTPTQLLRRDGVGYLRSRLKNWCELARIHPVVLITDLDAKACAPTLIDEWFARVESPRNLIFRVAVREIEAWLLADHDGINRLLGRTGPSRLPRDPDALADPKRHLLDLARGAPKLVRLDLLASAGSTARQGVGYNARLSGFVAHEWNPDRASERSESLRRTQQRLRDLATRLRP